MNPIKSWINYLIIERPAAKKTLAAWGEQLDTKGEIFLQRLAKLPHRDNNREMLSHIIGIEKWGQSRLKVALGEPFKHETSDGYRPPKNHSWEMLKAEFKATRRSTVALAQKLDTSRVDHSLRIKHDQYGELSLAGWLRYLDMHANSEGKRLK
jgi:hypothetical protein